MDLSAASYVFVCMVIRVVCCLFERWVRWFAIIVLCLYCDTFFELDGL